jgi:hypothetical protein
VLTTLFPVIILVVTFLHNFAFNAGTFYLALYYQVSRLFIICNESLVEAKERLLMAAHRWKLA